MQCVVANRTRRTFLWSLIPGVIRVTPGHTKSTVRVVTTTLFSPAVNSCLAVPRLTIIRWDSSYPLNFRGSVFRCSSTVTKGSEICEAAFYYRLSRIASQKFSGLLFHLGIEIWLFHFWARYQGFLSSTAKRFDIWYSYTSLTKAHCSKTDINYANWNSFLTSKLRPVDFRANFSSLFSSRTQIIPASLAYIFSACNCFVKYCRAEMATGATYTQFTSLPSTSSGLQIN